jgi:hypothetical protein
MPARIASRPPRAIAARRQARNRHRGVVDLATNVFVESLEERRLLANILVNTALDESLANSTTSLREAITQAQANGGDDNINFSIAAFPENQTTTITLVAGALNLTGVNGKVTINGLGVSRTVVSGNDASRIFTVGTNANVAINNLAMRDGFSSTAGGAIQNQGDLALDAVTLFENRVAGINGPGGSGATPGTGGGNVFGGAIWNGANGTLAITNSSLNNNEATGGNGGPAVDGNGGSGGNGSGAAIYALGPVTVADSSFSSNTALGGIGGNSANGAGGGGGDAYGGAVFLSNDLVASIERTDFSGNAAIGANGGNGGAANSGGNGGLATGGAISNVGLLDLTDCDLSSNLAFAGPGGFAADPGEGAPGTGGAVNNSGTMTVSGGLFNSNTAFGGGGQGGGDATGGALYNQGDLVVDDVEFLSNGAFGGAGTDLAGSAFGGAIGYNSGALTVNASILQFNFAQAGSGGTLSTAGAHGGAIYATGDISIYQTTIASNTATGASAAGNTGLFGGNALGGGIFLGSGFDAFITQTTISDNDAVAGQGGFNPTGNGGQGGSGLGGGIYCGDDLVLTLSTIYGNTATGGAGGTGAGTGGQGGTGAGGAASMDNITITATNVTVASNSAVGGAGGQGFAGPAAAGQSRGGAFTVSDVLTLINSIVTDNSAIVGPDIEGPVTLHNSLVSSPALDYSVTGGSVDYLTDTDPDLGPLLLNGGLTKTAVPADGSDAIDAGDTAAAIAAFGDNADDQRGPGFPRILGNEVDIGAVETGVVSYIVSGNGNEIVDGDAVPSTTDFTDFGSAPQGAPIVQRTFTLTNTGQGTLTVFDFTLPAGFVIVEPLDDLIPAGQSDTFTVGLVTADPGVFSGDVEIETNAPTAAATFTFAIVGQVTSDGVTRINFQPAPTPIPDNYLADSGQLFGDRGNGLSYGWNANAAGFTRDRNKNGDQRLDTLIHTQQYGARSWEIAVANGIYEITLAAGDAQYFDSVYRFNVEGSLALSGTPTSGNRFFTATKTVTVSDGRLTITNAAGSVNNKLDYIDIRKVEPQAIKVNFQPLAAPTAPGYLIDGGQVFGSRGNGFSYGWNASATGFTRDRDLNASQKFDTLVHTQLYGSRVWEIGVPNGTYSVLIMAGDAQYFDSVYKFNVEGQLTVNGTPSSGNRFISGTKTVTVSDGRLTIANASGAVNNKLAFVEITPV